ncbi:MAG TPA: phage portal protein [Pyrinomonadaceae bacterium]|nr:phage portal protein [Pyrinomonadaceae bacterium]
MLSLNLELPTFAEIRKERAEAQAAEDRRARKAALRRSYDAARVNRLTNDFTTVNTSANFELRRSLRRLRARSRDLARNNDYVKKFLSMVRNNVAGPSGMKLQARAANQRGELDLELNRHVERAWQRWSHCENSSASGRLSWVEIQRKAATLLARDGEVVLRMITADNAFGFALKFYSADWLDETFSERLPGGNRVVMSVELDPDDRPVAFYLTPPPSDFQFLHSPTPRYRTRVPAEEIIHLFLHDDENADDENQTRGVPWIHTAITRLKILGAYEEAELVAARVGACKMGFFKEETDEEEGFTGAEGEQETSKPVLMDSASPGQFGVIPKNYTFEQYDPTHPNTSYPSFIKGVLRGIAAGMEVTYFSLAEDLEGVNYSSARIGLLSERDTWRGLQNFLVEHLNRRVFLAWMRSAMLTGALRIRPSDYERLSEPLFQPRGWRWIDPLKEVQANLTAIEGGLDTRTDVVAEQGGDFEETLDTLAREQKLIEQKGVKLGAAGKKPTPPEDEDEPAPLKK